MESSLARLHPVEPEPVRALNDLILVITALLKDKVTSQHEQSTKLYDRQVDFGTQLAVTLPVFFPYKEQDIDKAETYSPLVVQEWHG